MLVGTNVLEVGRFAEGGGTILGARVATAGPEEMLLWDVAMGRSVVVVVGAIHPSFKGALTGHEKTRLGKYDFRPRLAETKQEN